MILSTITHQQGCNVRDVDIVVQWKLPTKLSSFIQRAGRVARGPDRTGLAVLLAEPTAFSVLLSDNLPELITAKEGKPTNGRGRKSSGFKKAGKTEKAYARSRGRFRGGIKCIDVLETLPQEPSLDDDDPTEGLYHFVQATSCRRRVVTNAFDNPDPGM